MKKEIFRLEKVTQIMDGVTLLNNFNLHIFQGEVMGLVCTNAHGKEALVELLCQNVPIHYGYIYFQEKLVNNYEHSSMNMNRVAVIEKQSRLIEDLTVVDNIFVLRRGFKKYLISPKVLGQQYRLFTEELDIHIDPEELVSNLSFFEKCVVEILKAVVSNEKLIVIRDISNFISTTDLKKIHDLIEHYSSAGISFLYICNHHEEAFKICNRISIMENGKILKVLNKKQFADEMITPYTLDFSRIEPQKGPMAENGIIRFENVSTENIHGMSFTVEKGQCVVLLDMNNTVLTDMMNLITYEMKPLSGKILLEGHPFRGKIYNKKSEVCFIQENPIHSMLFYEMSYVDNLCFLLDGRQPYFWINKKIRKSVIQEYGPLIGEDIYSNDILDLSPVSLYSLIYYRIHLYNPKVVFFVQPFSGADMYLRYHLIKLLNQLREKKITVIILAVSLSDSLVVADRLMVIEQGQLREEYESEEFHLFHARQKKDN
jgi:ribose transport system ATP-binding protein